MHYIRRSLLAVCLLVVSFALALHQAPSGEIPTYVRDVEPAMRRSCVPCHVRGGPAPFPLDTYSEVRKRAKQVTEDIGNYHMPPCNSSTDFGAFCTYKSITDQEYVQILEWINKGFQPGDPAKLPKAGEARRAWSLGKPHMVLRVGRGAVVPASTAPFWRTIKVSLPAESTIRGYEIKPLVPSVIRNVLIARGDASAKQGDRTAGGPSVVKMNPKGLVGSWAIGYHPTMLPADVGVRCKTLDVQVQYQPTGRPESGEFEIGLYFASPKAKPLAWQTLGLKSFVIPANQDVTVQSEWKVPADTKLYAIEPEAGFFPVTLSLVAKLPSGQTRKLALIERWNPYWQGAYAFANPVSLPKGTILIATSRYNNVKRNPHDFMDAPPEPQEIRSGSRPRDERFFMHLALGR